MTSRRIKIKRIILRVKPLNKVVKKLYLWRSKVYLKSKPEIILNGPFRHFFKKDINWEDPKHLIEKIQWLQLYSDTKLWTRCADKYLVREFVIERGCGDVLNELYGAWYDISKIDWENLPNSFVLKANHSAGQVMLIEDKNKLNKSEISVELNKWIKSNYGVEDGQLHYTKIKPCVIAEKLFVNKSNSNSSLIDYKIYCFHGVPECIIVVAEREKGKEYTLSLYDLEWNNISVASYDKTSIHTRARNVKRPHSLEKMIEVAKKLSKGFPQVRIDFYDIDDQAVFGEMTFTTGCPPFSEEYFNYLGGKIDLTKVNKLSKPNSL